MLVVAVSFQPGGALTTRLRLPAGLLAAAGIDAVAAMTRVLDERGATREACGSFTPERLAGEGIDLTLADQSAQVFTVEREGALPTGWGGLIIQE